MTALYMVVCGPHDGQPFHVADITDERPAGAGVRVENFRSHSVPVVPRNNRASRRQIVFACNTCGLESPPLADTSMAELLDAVRAGKSQPGVLTPIPAPVEVPRVDPDDLADVLTGRAPGLTWDIVGHEQRWLLSLKDMCVIISGLRDRGRR